MWILIEGTIMPLERDIFAQSIQTQLKLKNSANQNLNWKENNNNNNHNDNNKLFVIFA